MSAFQKPTTKTPIQIQTVNPTKSDLMDVASLRNNCTSPLQMIENQLRQKQLKSQIPKSQSIFNGMKIGIVVGGAIASITFLNNDGGTSLSEAFQTFLVVTLAVGGMLSINNLSGKNVFVYTEKEAINRLTVDNVPFLKSGDDLGFCVRLSSSSKSTNNERYSGTNGAVACMDGQLRNTSPDYISKYPFASSKQYGRLPSHFHLKNMLVDDQMRRQGIAYQLLDHVEKYVKQNTDADLLTLEVEDSNTGAISLYEKFGFVEGDTMGADRDYGSRFYVTGRTFMIKKI